MAKGLMIWNIISTAFNLLFAGLLVLFAFKAHKNAQKADQYARKAVTYEHLDKLCEDSSALEFAHAENGLWEVFRNQPIGGKSQEEYYRDVIRRNKSHLTSNNAYKQLRSVFDFYSRLATKYADGVIPGRLLFQFWPQEKLKIIPKVLIPIEEAVYEELNGKKPGEFTNLLKLYNDSLKT